MLTNIGFYSYGAALFAYSLLTVAVFFSKGGRAIGLPLQVACLATAIWAGIVVTSYLAAYPYVKLIQFAELVRNAAWVYMLLAFLKSRLKINASVLGDKLWKIWFASGLSVISAVMFAPELLTNMLPILEESHESIVFATWLAMSILILLLLEQIYRNSTDVELWSLKYLCLGLGVIFAYDFFMYAEALLFSQMDPDLWQARGAGSSIAAILIAIAVGRIERPDDTRSLYVSRHVAFHSVTLLASGVYLILMALVGYFIRYMGGTWGGVFQITFLCAAGLLLMVLLFSGQVRARTRVWLSKNFFSYKYDYRIEWLQFTNTLAAGGRNIPESIISAIGHLAQSPGGALWGRTEDRQLELLACHGMGMAQPNHPIVNDKLADWLQQSEWIIDLREWRRSPDLYRGLEVPPAIAEIPRGWLIIPLMLGDALEGILILQESELQSDLNWEDRDLLKVAGRQGASHLAQHQANRALVESRQFEAFNRLSAYVIHDLKNILAQQALIVSNAEKHRDNPAFVDDVIKTVENSVVRMTRLMEQMRSGVRGAEKRSVVLIELLHEAIDSKRHTKPAPILQTRQNDLIVEADRDQLTTVFSHLIQNAQEATSKTGHVMIRLTREGNNAVVEIEDDGVGMDEEFIQTRLFKPFDSTKGLTGMGIGVFESRELVRKLGGNIHVESSPGEGSLFSIVLPCAEPKVNPIISEKEITVE